VKLTLLLREACDYDEAPPLIFKNELGAFRVNKGKLIITSAEGSNEAVWRAKVDLFIKAWQLEHELCHGFHRFTFDKPSDEARAEQLRLRQKQAHETLIITMSVYPEPPTIRLTPEIANLWERWNLARLDIRETVESCAYYCLTVAEHQAGGRKEAAETFKIEPGILKKLGELTSTRGGPRTARKAPASAAKPLTKNEVQWIHLVIRNLILRMGLTKAGEAFEPLRPDDLPKL
jgi:hypothetical protein